MKFAISALSRNRAKWGVIHFALWELATFRERILRMKETDGIEGVKKFNRKLRRDTRSSSSTVLQL